MLHSSTLSTSVVKCQDNENEETLCTPAERYYEYEYNYNDVYEYRSRSRSRSLVDFVHDSMLFVQCPCISQVRCFFQIYFPYTSIILLSSFAFIPFMVSIGILHDIFPLFAGSHI